MSNINDDLNKFSLSLATTLKNDDERLQRYRDQRDARGFDDTETWSLDNTIARFIGPRLKRYIELADNAIVMSDNYKSDMLELSAAFDYYASDASWSDLDKRSEAFETIKRLSPQMFDGGLWW